jgi:hypothetical protein
MSRDEVFDVAVVFVLESNAECEKKKKNCSAESWCSFIKVTSHSLIQGQLKTFHDPTQSFPARYQVHGKLRICQWLVYSFFVYSCLIVQLP